MSGLYTRGDMVRAMTHEFNAEVTDVTGRDWRRLTLLMVHQGDVVLAGERTDFHLIELSHAGRHRLRLGSETEHGAHHETVLLPGALGYVQPHVPVFQEAEGEATLQQICIDRSVFEEVAAALLPGDPARARTMGFQGVFEPRLKRLAEDLLEEARRPSSGTDLAADLIAQQMALLILRRQGDRALREPRGRTLSDAELGRVIDHMEAQMEEVGGIDTLAALIGWDPFAFTRAFKARTGQTPHAYLTDRRIQRIKGLLRETDDPLAEIALATGFASQSHMTSTFSRHVGLSPGRWRRDATS